MSEPKSHINERLRTEFANSGRAAGMGISYDRYGDESGRPCYDPGCVRVHMPSDDLTPKQRAALNGEVKVYKGGKHD